VIGLQTEVATFLHLFLHRFGLIKDAVYFRLSPEYLCSMLKSTRKNFKLNFLVENHNGKFKLIRQPLATAPVNEKFTTPMHEQFFNLSPDMLCIVGYDGCFKQISPAFKLILGFSKEEMIGKPFKDFIIQDDQERSSAELSSIKDGNSAEHFENRYLSKDGTVKWMAWRTVNVPAEKLIYAVARDITEQKKTELALKDQSEKLNELIKYKNSGLRYGRLLQDALFHDPETLKDIFTDSFIFHNPKDIVSGDFYWFKKNGNKAYIACADATGHGVPGAIISVMGVNKLQEIIASKRKITPSGILNKLNTLTHHAFSNARNGKKEGSDGMDISLFSVDLKTNKLQYAGANNSLFIVRNKELLELTATKSGIGAKALQSYKNNNYQLEKGDMVYAFTDGYADQFGGEKGKKFMYRHFKNLLISCSEKSAAEQKKIFSETIQTWMGDHEQVDDMCIVGVRI
jgi:PAS domain S-box-containing protein